MMQKKKVYGFGFFPLLLSVLFFCGQLLAQDKEYPDQPQPPRLVNDFAHLLNPDEASALEGKLEEFSRTTSNEITIVTIKSIGDRDVAEYATRLGKYWGVGKSGRNNGVVILVALEGHKINISPGKGLEGALTDLMCGRIIRNEMAPPFRTRDYYEGFNRAADAIIAATKGEYKGEPEEDNPKMPAAAIILIVLFVLFMIWLRRRNGGGGNYMSRGGMGNIATGFLMGNLMGGMFGGGSNRDSGGRGGFGGFGGGDFGGGGASGSW